MLSEAPSLFTDRRTSASPASLGLAFAFFARARLAPATPAVTSTPTLALALAPTITVTITLNLALGPTEKASEVADETTQVIEGYRGPQRAVDPGPAPVISDRYR